jgi:hypothetical protein
MDAAHLCVCMVMPAAVHGTVEVRVRTQREAHNKESCNFNTSQIIKEKGTREREAHGQRRQAASGVRRRAYLGRITDLTAWITPLVALMSALVTCARRGRRAKGVSATHTAWR